MTRVIDRGESLLREIREIAYECFVGVERGPEAALLYNYRNGELFVERVQGLPMSFAIVTRDKGQPFIWMIATFGEARRQGFASHLLKEIVAWATEQHADWIELTVKIDNPAQKLYFDHGFRVIKVLPRHYGEENGLRMRRTL